MGSLHVEDEDIVTICAKKHRVTHQRRRTEALAQSNISQRDSSWAVVSRAKPAHLRSHQEELRNSYISFNTSVRIRAVTITGSKEVLPKAFLECGGACFLIHH